MRPTKRSKKYKESLNGANADYKKLKGAGKDGYQYKFKVDQQYSVLTNEESTDEQLLIFLGSVGYHH